MLYDVILIGGGVVGCATARELARYNLSVALLEKTEDICNGQSKANTAIVHGGYDAAPGSNKAKFNVRGNAMFERITRSFPCRFRATVRLSFHLKRAAPGASRRLKQRGEATA